jgi:hypothetical protein
MTSQTLQNSYELYRLTHETYPKHFVGFSIKDHIHEIGGLIKYSNITTCIDYGCGKALAWKKYNLRKLWQLREVTLFDPGVAEFAMKPTEPADIVLCVDVLEHVPKEAVDEVLGDLEQLAKKVIFLTISTRPASKKLVDGSNAHATVKPVDWWQAKINQLNKLVIVHYIS